MTESLLSNVDKYLSSGKYIGGGVNGKFERMSFGIFFSAMLIIIPLLLSTELYLWGFWCYRKDFMAINGFNENMLMAEDADFMKRLKEWGKRNNKKFGTIKME